MARDNVADVSDFYFLFPLDLTPHESGRSFVPPGLTIVGHHAVQECKQTCALDAMFAMAAMWSGQLAGYRYFQASPRPRGVGSEFTSLANKTENSLSH